MMEGKAKDSIDSNQQHQQQRQQHSSDLELSLATLKIVDDPQLTDDTATPSSSAAAAAAGHEEDAAALHQNNIYSIDSIEPFLIEPFGDPWAADTIVTEDDDPFTEEELINVLRSFEEDPSLDDDDNNNSAEDLLDFPTGQALPELDIQGGDDSLLLAPAEFTASIFDPPPAATTTSNNDSDSEEESEFVGKGPLRINTAVAAAEQEAGGEPLHDEKKGDFDDDLGLLEGLQNLNLDWPSQDDDYNDDIPPYLYCQPCTPGGTAATSFSLASIAEDQALLDSSTAVAFSHIETERPRLPEKEFDTLLHLSLLNAVDDGENPYLSEAEMDSLFEVGNHTGNDNHNNNNAVAASHAAHNDDGQDGRGGEHGQHDMMHTHQQYHHSAEEDQQQAHTHEEEEQFNVSHRPEAFDAASEILSSFVVANNNKSGLLANERSCIGHKETIFGAAFSECGTYLATASQDSTVRIWNAETNAALSTLKEHSTDYECLRVAWASSSWAKDTLDRGKESDYSSLIATAGADGTVKVWANKDPSDKDAWVCCATLDHSNFDRVPANPEDEAEKPQVYAIQWIDHWSGLPVLSEKTTQNSFLLTSSDDFIHLWELESKPAGDSKTLRFREVMSLNFVPFQNEGYGVSVCQVTSSGLGLQSSDGEVAGKSNASSPAQKAFGGDRNPNNMIFAFDADYCPANGLLGVALSDGSLRLINGRGVCISIMQLPGCQSHLTSFSWDSTGTRLATCVATGHVILWGMDVHDDKGSLTTTCTAILEGGHEPGRPVFGSKYFAAGENLLLTWGVDGRLCLWDSFSLGNINAPIATLVANADYPIYAVDVQPSYVAVGGGGGGGEASFLGVPVRLYDTRTKKSATSDDDDDRQKE